MEYIVLAGVVGAVLLNRKNDDPEPQPVVVVSQPNPQPAIVVSEPAVVPKPVSRPVPTPKPVARPVVVEEEELSDSESESEYSDSDESVDSDEVEFDVEEDDDDIEFEVSGDELELVDEVQEPIGRRTRGKGAYSFNIKNNEEAIKLAEDFELCHKQACRPWEEWDQCVNIKRNTAKAERDPKWKQFLRQCDDGAQKLRRMRDAHK